MNKTLIIIIISLALFSLLIIQIYYHSLKYNKYNINLNNIEEYENSLINNSNYKLNINSIKNLLNDYYNLKL